MIKHHCHEGGSWPEDLDKQSNNEFIPLSLTLPGHIVTGLSFPKETAEEVTLIYQLDLSWKVTSPVVTAQGGL